MNVREAAWFGIVFSKSRFVYQIGTRLEATGVSRNGSWWGKLPWSCPCFVIRVRRGETAVIVSGQKPCTCRVRKDVIVARGRESWLVKELP